jgi:spermidine synthase
MRNKPPAAAAAQQTRTNRDRRLLSFALHATAFLGALLLFQVQPLLGKAVLPWFGGASAVWTTVMLFFQSALVAGYALVFLATRYLRPSARSYGYLVLVIAAACLLPILPTAAWKPTPNDEPVRRILALLAVCVGGPYLLLSMTGPFVQDAYFRAFPARSPYRLFALSNLGSLLGLLSYPFLVEPAFDVPTQANAWTVGFVVFGLLAIFCAWATRNDTPPPSLEQALAARLGLRRILKWIALAFGGSWMMLAVTNHLCQDVATVPLLWVVPLALYLATFILSFEYPAAYRRLPWAIAVLGLILAACATIAWLPAFVGIHLAALFVVCMLCHGELARLRPNPQSLTLYYLCIAVGGAMGGLYVGVIAPLVYTRDWEWIFATVVAFVFAAIIVAAALRQSGRLQSRAVQALYVVAFFAGQGFIAWQHSKQFKDEQIASARNFYGTIMVVNGLDKTTRKPVARVMQSGTTVHGAQVLDEILSHYPTTYYTADSGVGLTLLHLQDVRHPCRVGMIGLGVGTLATYGRPGDVFRFYEINPAVVRLCDDFFTYLRDSRATCTTVLGDARLTLEQEVPQGFDLLVLDAFTGDSIPAHLISVEAFELYLRHLRADGILAVHTSNRHLRLAPVLAAAARQLGLHGLVVNSPENLTEMKYQTEWILLTRDAGSRTWRKLQSDRVVDLATVQTVRLWTDAYSNILGILK